MACANARRVAVERLQVVARGVVAVHEAPERPGGEVLGERERHAVGGGRARHQRAHERVPGAERGAVHQVNGHAHARPAATAGGELAEQLHVVVARAEDPLVKRLLGGPDGRGGGAGHGPVHGAAKLDHSGSVTRGAPAGS